MRRFHGRPVLLAAVALGFGPGLAACGSDDEPAATSAALTSTTTSTTRTPAKATSARPSASEALPDFSGVLADGSRFTQADVGANTVIKVFASWCPTCEKEAATFAAFQKAHPDLTYVYVAVADTPEESAAWIERHGMADGPVIDDRERSVAGALGLIGQPNTVFVPAAGELVEIIGPGTAAQFRDAANAL